MYDTNFWCRVFGETNQYVEFIVKQDMGHIYKILWSTFWNLMLTYNWKHNYNKLNDMHCLNTTTQWHALLIKKRLLRTPHYLLAIIEVICWQIKGKGNGKCDSWPKWAAWHHQYSPLKQLAPCGFFFYEGFSLCEVHYVQKAIFNSSKKEEERAFSNVVFNLEGCDLENK